VWQTLFCVFSILLRMYQQTYSSVAAQGVPAPNKFNYNRGVEVTAKFKNPMKRFEIYEELEKLRFDFRLKLAAIIQLPGLKVLFHTNEVDQAIELREKLALSAKIEEVARYGENEIRVTICRVPPQFKNEEIAEVLKCFGDVFKINVLTDRYGIQIGKRHVFFKKNTMTELPRFLSMGGVNILAYYNGQPPFCEHCREKGHERDVCDKLQNTKEMWRKHREKENIEGQSRHPLLDPATQRGEEGSNQPQERIPEIEAESTKAGCPDKDGFITEKKKRQKKRHREEVSPQKFITKCCRQTLNDSKNAQLCLCNITFYHCKCGEWISEKDIDRCYPCKNCNRTMVKCRPPCRRGYSLEPDEEITCTECKACCDTEGARSGPEEN